MLSSIPADRSGAPSRLYDLRADPRGVKDVAAIHPRAGAGFTALTARLEAEQRQSQAATAASRETPAPADPGVLEQLRSLGYLR